MKSLIIIVFTFLFSLTFAQAQDVILKRNGEEIIAKVLSINPTDIKYKRFDNLEGPDIYILKTDVFMITYQNGTKEVMPQPTQPQQPKTQVQQDKKPLVQSPLGVKEPTQQTVKLGGPRVGVTYIAAGKTRDMLKDEFGASPIISQFGWQFETRFFTTDQGTSGMVEFVPLIGGLEQGLFLPSLNCLVAIREKSGYEFGVGPNLSLAGAALVFAVGTSFQTSGVNFPVNFAVVPSKNGARFSLVVGFNTVK
ncbi:MAG: hypothetical protein ACXWDO_12740 [Bacteroidia bacterium]